MHELRRPDHHPGTRGREVVPDRVVDLRGERCAAALSHHPDACRMIRSSSASWSACVPSRMRPRSATAKTLSRDETLGRDAPFLLCASSPGYTFTLNQSRR